MESENIKIYETMTLYVSKVKALLASVIIINSRSGPIEKLNGIIKPLLTCMDTDLPIHENYQRIYAEGLIALFNNPHVPETTKSKVMSCIFKYITPLCVRNLDSSKSKGLLFFIERISDAEIHDLPYVKNLLLAEKDSCKLACTLSFFFEVMKFPHLLKEPMDAFLQGIKKVEYPVSQVFGRGVALGCLDYQHGVNQILTMMKANKDVGLLILNAALTCVEDQKALDFIDYLPCLLIPVLRNAAQNPAYSQLLARLLKLIPLKRSGKGVKTEGHDFFKVLNS